MNPPVSTNCDGIHNELYRMYGTVDLLEPTADNDRLDDARAHSVLICRSTMLFFLFQQY